MPQMGRSAVTDRVLHQRLQHERWHQSILYSGLNIDRGLQPFFEPDLLQVQITLDKRQFLHQRNILVVVCRHGDPQQLAELFNHPAGSPRFPLHFGRNCIQRVEQEMRMQFRAQRFEARLRQQTLQFGVAHFPAPQVGRIIEQQINQQQHPVDEEPALEGSRQHVLRQGEGPRARM